MAGEIDFAAVNGLSRKVYDKAVKNALVASAILQRRFELSNEPRVSDTYQQSVVLDPPNGFTYHGSTGAVVQLKQARNMVVKQAAIAPFSMTLREQVGIDALSRLQSQGEGALASLVGEMQMAMKTAIANRLEACLLLGQRSYGTVESVTGTDGVSMAVVLTEASWRPGLWWAFGKNSTWHTFQSGGTARNATNPIILTGINAATRTVTFSITGTVATNAAVGDTFHPEGARTGASAYNEMPGLLAQASNTSSTLVGIDPTTYPNFAGNTRAVAGNLSYTVAEDCFAELRDRGADGKLVLMVPNKTWSFLAAELQAARVFDSSYSTQKAKVGVRALGYETPDAGEVEILNHPFLARGEALVLPEEEVKRLGSQDITFGVPGVDSGAFWERVPGYTAAELQAYTDQTVLLKNPAQAMYLSGITHV